MRSFLTLLPLAVVLVSCTADKGPDLDPAVLGIPVPQTKIVRINAMPYIPDTYQMLDWRRKAIDYDRYVFDWNRNDEVGALIWEDKNSRPDNPGFGLYTTVKDSRQGPSSPTSHEAINTMAAVLSGGLVGIDKTSQDGRNYPKMLQNYFASANNWKIMTNGAFGYAKDWWYNVLPNLLYFGVCDVFPGVDGADDIQKTISEQFKAADEAMGSSYDYSYFDFGNMTGVAGGLPKQQDAAGGHGYLLLEAYRKFGDETYLEHAKNAIGVLNSQSESRFYEILLPFGIYAAAYLNAACGTDYALTKMMDWTFNGCSSSSGRKGWGVIVGKWGDYDVFGLQGSITDGGGYAFTMNSFEMAWPLVPMVKYQPQYANMIGIWMLNNASATRLFYPGCIDDDHQFAPSLKNLTNNNIAYEGLRYSDRYGVFDVCPIAEGDGPTWTSKNGIETMFSLYSTSPVGVFGSIITKTDVEGIIRLDCNVTDFYADRPYPVNMYYNPFKTPQTVTYDTEHLTYGNLKYASGKYDLFDIVTRNYLVQGASGPVQISLSARSAHILVEIPAGTSLMQDENARIYADGHIIAW
ncbi:MAG: hypothetical protein GX899_06545 [Rikenellaceae bacterium]|nr:hypothetical protein [Rikenellaceae bacterium]